MSEPESDDPTFHTTRWSVVVAAGAEPSDDARKALATLCRQYWYPLYAFARRTGASVHEAQDQTQDFFATLLDKGYLGAADRERGRFRTFLLTAFRRHVSKLRDKASAKKRGGDRTILSLDYEAGERRYRNEPSDDTTAERIYERRWVLTLLSWVLARLRDECSGEGKLALFDAARPFLGAGGPVPSHRELAERLHMTPGAVKVAVHRLRKRYRELLREEIAQTVESDAEIDDEIRHLMTTLQR